MKKLLVVLAVLVLTSSVFGAVLNADPYPGMSVIWTNITFNNRTASQYTFIVKNMDDKYSYSASYNRNHLDSLKDYTYQINPNSIDDKLRFTIAIFKVTTKDDPNPYKLTIKDANGLENNYISYCNEHGQLFFVIDPTGKNQIKNITVNAEMPIPDPDGSDQYYGKTIFNIVNSDSQNI